MNLNHDIVSCIYLPELEHARITSSECAQFSTPHPAKGQSAKVSSVPAHRTSSINVGTPSGAVFNTT